MSVQNPERVVTKQDLADFYEGIFPYLGGNAEAGFTPIGTIIAVMGKTAPTNYLACNGQIVNISDYPELANYFKAQFGSYNYFGGNGTTTFAICDLRGEFLRGTGTNSHANQGSGASVGTHQDSTDIEAMVLGTNPVIPAVAGEAQSVLNYDSLYKLATNKYVINSSLVSSSDNYYQYRTLRPTNTSVLYCIATKNIYLNPSNSYSLEEQVIGQWIDGSVLYQKTVQTDYVTLTTSETRRIAAFNMATYCSGMTRMIDYSGIFIRNDVPSSKYFLNTLSASSTFSSFHYLTQAYDNTIQLMVNASLMSSVTQVKLEVTVKYIK